MQMVNFLAQLWGFSIVIVFLALLINKRNVESIVKLVENDGTLFLMGIINIVFGVSLILFYHTWSLSWAVLITALNCLPVLRGILILFFPDFVVKIVRIVKKHSDWISIGLVVGILLGCFLIYMGFNY